MGRLVAWHATAETDFKHQFPAALQDAFVLALEKLAAYQEPELVVTRHGHPFDNAVWKIKAKDKAGQWRVIYVKGHEEALYVVNAYQKKSPSGGSEEAPNDIKNTRERLFWAEGRHKVHLAIEAKKQAEAKSKTREATKGKRRGGKV